MPTLKQERLDMLATVENGWYDGQGFSVPLHIIQDPTEHPTISLGTPFAYPMLCGGVQLEWDSRSHNLNIDGDWWLEVEITGEGVEITLCGQGFQLEQKSDLSSWRSDTEDLLYHAEVEY